MNSNKVLARELLDLKDKVMIQKINKLYLICNMLFGNSEAREVKSLEIIKEQYLQMYNKLIETGQYEKYKDIEVIETSAVTHKGLEELKYSLLNLLDSINDINPYEDNEFEDFVLYEFKSEKPYKISKENDNTWIISGEKLELLLKMTRFNSDEAALRFARKLKNLGIDEELKEKGAKDGDIVKILDSEFEYNERLNY